ncbi:MAG: hypothetical protein RLZZ261_480 [Bacteroidota bacterium]|jgi:hypothetical protein
MRIGCLRGGLLGAASLACLGAAGQVVVRNGLSHFHPLGLPATGVIELYNSSTETVTAVLSVDSLWGPQRSVQLPSEVALQGKERKTIRYVWPDADSSSQGTRIYLTTVPKADTVHQVVGTMRINVTTRYAVDLYRGPIGDAVSLSWNGDSVTVTNASPDFWAGTCYSLHGLERGTHRIASGVLRPGDRRTWVVPPNSDGVWLENVRGQVAASLKP